MNQQNHSSMNQENKKQINTEKKGLETGRPLPRFVSLKSSKVNMRRGPGKEFRIDWVYYRKNLPVKIIFEYLTILLFSLKLIR